MIAKNNKTLLFVEDEVLVAMEKQQELEKYGYTVVTVHSGKDAVAISRENCRIDLILMDIELGSGIDGTEAAGLILKEQKIPIIFISSYTEPKIVKKTEKIVSYGYIVKSTDITVLDASIKMALKLFNANEETECQLLTKEVLLKEVHHRIKNNFASIGSLISLQAQSATTHEVQSALQDTIGHINSMRILYEKLLMTDDYNNSSLKQYLNNLVDRIISLFPESVEISVEKQIDDTQLDSKRLVPVGIIVNELLTNIIKYAFTGLDSGLVVIVLKENDGNITLTIQDNGRGLPNGFNLENQSGFGLMLIKLLTQQLDGSFTIVNNKGTKSTLKFTI